MAVDTETTGVEFFDTPFCASVAWKDEAGGVHSHFFDLEERDAGYLLGQIMADVPHLVFHNAKFDLQKLILVGIIDRQILDPARLWDTECMIHLLNEQSKKSLKYLAEALLGLTTDEETELRAVRKRLGLKKADGYDAIPREIIMPYALKDAEFTIQLFHHLLDPLRERDLRNLHFAEMRLLLVLLDMETAGMGVDLDYLRSTVKEYADEILTLELSIRDMTNEEFNPGSWQQITAAMDERGYKIANTKRETLEGLDDELASAISKLRALKKIHGTYLKPMLTHQRDGVIYPNFRQWGTRGRRMSSGEAENG